MKAKRKKRLRPPDDFNDDEKKQFKILAADLEAAGRFESIDRAILILAAQTASAYKILAANVAERGAVIDYPHNNMRGVSPDFKAMQACARLLRGLLSDMGLNPISRPKSTGQPVNEPLEI